MFKIGDFIKIIKQPKNIKENLINLQCKIIEIHYERKYTCVYHINYDNITGNFSTNFWWIHFDDLQIDHDQSVIDLHKNDELDYNLDFPENDLDYFEIYRPQGLKKKKYDFMRKRFLKDINLSEKEFIKILNRYRQFINEE